MGKNFRAVALLFQWVGLMVSGPVQAGHFIGEGLPGKHIHSKLSERSNQKEVVVLVHGNGLDSSSFDPIMPVLKKHYVVLTYDQRGQGRTRYNGPDFTVKAMVSDLENVVRFYGLKRVHLIGHSFGARIAMAFAALHSDQVLSVVVEDMDLIARQPVSEERCLGYANELRRLNRTYVSYDEMMQTFSRVYDSETLKTIRYKTLPNGSVKVIEHQSAPYAWGCFANGADLNDALVRYSGPVLFLRADPKQSALTEKGLIEIKKKRPQVSVANFPASHHVIHLFDPRGFLQAIGTFLKDPMRPLYRRRFGPNRAD